jgi:hypothetical protein
MNIIFLNNLTDFSNYCLTYEYQVSEFEKAWVKKLKITKTEKDCLLPYYRSIKKDSIVLGTFYLFGIPKYIHKKIIANNVEFLVEVDDWMLLIYEKLRDFKLNFIDKQAEIKTNKERRAKLKEENDKRKQRLNQMCEKSAELWLNKSKRNLIEWQEAFEPKIIEENHLLQLLDKKMLQ